MNKEKKIDCLFLITKSSGSTYQKLSITYSAIEPPTWALLLAQSMRAAGNEVKILDSNAEDLSKEEILERVLNFSPRLICIVVYGQNVNAGTTNMSGATYISNFLKDKKIKIPISFIGSHVQALPIETLSKEKSIDFLFTNEGVYALRNVLKLEDFSLKKLEDIKGIAFRKADKIIINEPEKIVPNEKMDEDLPGYAWDLLPYKKNPLDLYRSPMWHAEYDFEKRSPYASLQTREFMRLEMF